MKEKYDNKEKYNGFKNTYEVQWEEKKITFLPLQLSTNSQGSARAQATINPLRLFYTHLQHVSQGWVLVNKGVEKKQD